MDDFLFSVSSYGWFGGESDFLFSVSSYGWFFGIEAGGAGLFIGRDQLFGDLFS